jgi:hypothetical protein
MSTSAGPGSSRASHKSRTTRPTARRSGTTPQRHEALGQVADVRDACRHSSVCSGSSPVAAQRSSSPRVSARVSPRSPASMPARTWASSSAGRRTSGGSLDLGAMKRRLAPSGTRNPGSRGPPRSLRSLRPPGRYSPWSPLGHRRTLPTRQSTHFPPHVGVTAGTRGSAALGTVRTQPVRRGDASIALVFPV